MGVPSWAVKGAKVVCIKREPWTLIYGTSHGPDPAYGDVVTIEATSAFGKFVMLELVGFFDLYGVDSFRPLHTIETDIEAHFKALLNVPNQVDA